MQIYEAVPWLERLSSTQLHTLLTLINQCTTRRRYYDKEEIDRARTAALVLADWLDEHDCPIQAGSIPLAKHLRDPNDHLPHGCVFLDDLQKLITTCLEEDRP